MDKKNISSYGNPQRPDMILLFIIVFAFSAGMGIFLILSISNNYARVITAILFPLFSCYVLFLLIATEILARPTNVIIADNGLELTFAGRWNKSFRWEEIDVVSKTKPASVERKQGGIIKPHGSRKLYVSREIAEAIQSAYVGEHHYEKIHGSDYLFRKGVSYDAKKDKLIYS